MYTDDEKLIEFVDIARKYKIRMCEMAIHSGYADEAWGSFPCSVRLSPLAHMVRGGKCFGAFAGINAVVDAINHVPAAMEFLGLDKGAELDTNAELKAAAAAAFAKLLDVISSA